VQGVPSGLGRSAIMSRQASAESSESPIASLGRGLFESVDRLPSHDRRKVALLSLTGWERGSELDEPRVSAVVRR